jgi:Tfp pilus assembly PilM family ATPase
MPQYLAIAWESAECRVAVASLRGRQIVIEQAFSFPRAADESPDDLGARIAKELDARGCGRPEALVSVGRTRIELRQLTVPPAADDDLPDLVRFQAAREFNELDDRWRLDFLPIDTGGESAKTVLATAIAPAEIGAIEKVCERAGLTLRRILLRPCEAASLLGAGGAKLPQLLIELFAEEVDLTVLRDGKTVFLRTTRFAGQRPPLPALVAEIRLTMAAARNQLGAETGESVKLDSLVLCGHEAADEQLAQSVQAELGLPVTLLDPFEGMSVAPPVLATLPPHADRFAPLLGMLQAELRGTAHAIDFLHPRRKPEPVNRRKLWISLAAAAAVLVVAYFIYSQVTHILLAADVARMKKQATDKETALQEAKKKTGAKVAYIKKWADQDTIWLEELYELSREIPPARDVMFTSLTMSVNARSSSSQTDYKSQMDIKGATRTKETFGEMAEAVRGGAGTMLPKDVKEASRSGATGYPWQFEATLLIEKEPDKDAVKTAQKGPDAPSATSSGTPPKISSASPAKAAAAASGTSAVAPAKTSGAPAKASATGAAP